MYVLYDLHQEPKECPAAAAAFEALDFAVGYEKEARARHVKSRNPVNPSNRIFVAVEVR
jgi:hypothetical protein